MTCDGSSSPPSYPIFTLWEERYGLIKADRWDHAVSLHQQWPVFWQQESRKGWTKVHFFSSSLQIHRKLRKTQVKKQQSICREPYILTPKYPANFFSHCKQIWRYISRKVISDFKSIFRSTFKKGCIFTGWVARGTQWPPGRSVLLRSETVVSFPWLFE